MNHCEDYIRLDDAFDIIEFGFDPFCPLDKPATSKEVITEFISQCPHSVIYKGWVKLYDSLNDKQQADTAFFEGRFEVDALEELNRVLIPRHSFAS